MDSQVIKPGVTARLLRFAMLAVSAFLLLQLISLYLSWEKQAVLGVITVGLGVAANRMSKSHVVTLALMLISVTATLRYGWWRVHLVFNFFSDASNHRIRIDSIFLLVLLSAEAYTFLIMLLGYMQTMWPLHRKPVQLPDNEGDWPHVDVLIPTYNEPLSLVRYTAIAARNIDYPPEKLHVYLLDDGSREDFRCFAAEAGVGYITREQHKHAKAGNINHALTQIGSPFVTIFDCDHVPTRSFLQMTLGWMLIDKRLAMLQTPHHFYSPDPFERNLIRYQTIPNEGELFYGIIQDGNDFWNATFFCGSCAVIRRSALDEVGGIATETVTEDAHTSLRLQKRGYNTAYINIPQAAGLATETLAAHIGQRVRWARGMIQILRIENPLFAKGMKFTQRLCYFNAMLHFMYAVPRLIFLGAPLVYMLLGLTIIPGYWVAILVYALPHLFLSSLTNSRIQGTHRHSFWNEIYETVLAPYILAPTLLALINPKLGTFNVTGKGSTLEETRFDNRISAPTKWMLALNFLGVAVAPYRLFVKDPNHPGTVIVNLLWILFNIVILGVAAAVAHEQKQRRTSVRIAATVPVTVTRQRGRRLEGMSVDMSVGGAAVRFDRPVALARGERLKVAFPAQAGDRQVRAVVVGDREGLFRLEFIAPTLAEQETITLAIYSRADAWVPRNPMEADRPLLSLARVIRLSFSGIYQMLRSFFPTKPSSTRAKIAQPAALLLCSLTLLSACLAQAQYPLNAMRMLSATASQSAAASSATQVIALQDMGQQSDIALRGPHTYYSVHFTLSNTQIPRSAVLRLFYSVDQSLNPGTTSLTLNLNGVPIATLPPPAAADGPDRTAETPIIIPPDLLVRHNTLTFEFTGGGSSLEPRERANAPILASIKLKTTLEVTGVRLRLENDLALLPLPFYDNELSAATTLSFVLPAHPSPQTLEAAGIVASWFGILARGKPPRFSVSIGRIPAGNAIVFYNSLAAVPASLQLPADGLSALALTNNPVDPDGTLLVLSAPNDDQLLTVARALSLTGIDPSPVLLPAFHGHIATIANFRIPPDRINDDAPRWMPSVRFAPLWDCHAQQTITTDGSASLPIYFHVPPDLYYGEKQNLNLYLRYRYDAAPVAVGSALRLDLNGRLVTDDQLPPGTGLVTRQRQLLLPVAGMRPFGNTALFQFDFVPRDSLHENAASAFHGEVLCGSALDLNGLAHWTSMPNLELFANAGFPFTRRADLAETVVVLPDVPGPDAISLYLYLMSHFGAQTGYPVLRVTVADQDAALEKGRDYLVIGTIANHAPFAAIDFHLPVTLDGDGLHVKQRNGIDEYFFKAGTGFFRWWSRLLQEPVIPNLALTGDEGLPDAIIEEIESPASASRSIVLVELKDEMSADQFAAVFLARSQSDEIAQSVSLLRGDRFSSYAMAASEYHVGNISTYSMMRIWLTRYFVFLLLLVTALSLAIATWAYAWLRYHARERLKLAHPLPGLRQPTL
jgi:cellulose synthase (UDP-forming)